MKVKRYELRKAKGGCLQSASAGKEELLVIVVHLLSQITLCITHGAGDWRG